MSITRAGGPSSPARANGAFRGRFAADLTRFSRHKRKLLDALAEGHRRGPNLGAFDKEKSWNDLLHFARYYFAGEAAKKQEESAKAYVKQLTEFADHIGKVRRLVPVGIHGDVGSYIFWMWSRKAKHGMSSPVADFDRFFAILPELEMAARKAASWERAKPGRPRGPSVLPSSEALIGLAAAYRRCTGLKPGAGQGSIRKICVELSNRTRARWHQRGTSGRRHKGGTAPRSHRRAPKFGTLAVCVGVNIPPL